MRDSQTTSYAPNTGIGPLSERATDAYERLGWDAWHRGRAHDDCPYHDERREPYQFGWRAAEQMYRKACADAR